ncbi:nuclear transport factor 2 family protein [Pontibacter pamirensis]|uniref:nuclear transport factor 2 family protein n=1 Tax=Pontibacter pamirensis TaxID=2562824 RepID=UPI0013895DF6|nr:nuclear transport factor 2 family protein [Pontibacter pamirensis]
MKKYFFPLIVLLMLTSAACAQSKSATASVREPKTIDAGAEAAVAVAVEKFNQAMVSADRGQLEELTAEQLSYGHSSGKVQDKTVFVDDVVNGPFDFLTINAEDQTITLAGETAIVRQIFTSEATNNGAPTNIRIGNMLVWQKQNREWKLLARQAFKL